jgi:hypothetical protein
LKAGRHPQSIRSAKSDGPLPRSNTGLIRQNYATELEARKSSRLKMRETRHQSVATATTPPPARSTRAVVVRTAARPRRPRRARAPAPLGVPSRREQPPPLGHGEGVRRGEGAPRESPRHESWRCVLCAPLVPRTHGKPVRHGLSRPPVHHCGAHERSAVLPHPPRFVCFFWPKIKQELWRLLLYPPRRRITRTRVARRGGCVALRLVGQ